MPRSVKKLTNERNKTHGNFENVAAASQGLLAVLVQSPNWPTLSSARRESVFLICHKIGRIVSGDPGHADHWDDIGGYAELGKNDGQRPRRVARAVRALKRRVAKVKKTKAFKETQKKLRKVLLKKKVKARRTKSSPAIKSPRLAKRVVKKIVAKKAVRKARSQPVLIGLVGAADSAGVS